LRSPVYTSAELAHLETRIEGHVQALLVGGDALGPFLRPGLLADRAPLAFAAAYPLLRAGTGADGAAGRAGFLRAHRAAPRGGCRAWAQGPPRELLPARRRALAPASPPTAVAAARVLAFRWPSELTDLLAGRSRTWFRQKPEVRRAAWHLAALRGEPFAPRDY